MQKFEQDCAETDSEVDGLPRKNSTSAACSVGRIVRASARPLSSRTELSVVA